MGSSLTHCAEAPAGENKEQKVKRRDVTEEDGMTCSAVFCLMLSVADMAAGWWYPTAPTERPFNNYNKGIRDFDPKNEGEADVCHKDTHSHSALTPGILGIFCPHGFCLGCAYVHGCVLSLMPSRVHAVSGFT